MKKEIEALLASENAYLKLNRYCTLHRWTKSGCIDVDKLEVNFSILSVCGQAAAINSRDWRGIVEEVQAAQTAAFAAVAEELNGHLRNGYIS